MTWAGLKSLFARTARSKSFHESVHVSQPIPAFEKCKQAQREFPNKSRSDQPRQVSELTCP